MTTESALARASEELDEHICQIMHWHFREETGCPFWLEKKNEFNFDPLTDVKSASDFVEKFENFDGNRYLRSTPREKWRPKGFAGVSASMWVTGGTTGRPMRRWGRRGKGRGESDFADDYHQLNDMLPDDAFPREGLVLYVGPCDMRRLKRGVEIIAELRGCDFDAVEFNPGWQKSKRNPARTEMGEDIVERAVIAIRRDNPTAAFLTAELIEGIGEKLEWTDTSIQGVFSGGTQMDPKKTQNIVEEHFGGDQIQFFPAFGNALVGLAPSRKVATNDNPIPGQRLYSQVYQSFLPRTWLRVTNPGDSRELVSFGERGPIEITTLSKEWLMPRFLDRDEGERVAPTEEYPWDGVAEIGPVGGSLGAAASDGVY